VIARGRFGISPTFAPEEKEYIVLFSYYSKVNMAAHASSKEAFPHSNLFWIIR
jgi:hypothetical protein